MHIAHVLPLVGFLHRISLRLVCCFSEQFHDINAGLVVSIGDPNADVIDLSMPVKDLERVLFASRDVLLASSVPSQPPTTMLRQGTC